MLLQQPCRKQFKSCEARSRSSLSRASTTAIGSSRAMRKHLEDFLSCCLPSSSLNSSLRTELCCKSCLRVCTELQASCWSVRVRAPRLLGSQGCTDPACNRAPIQEDEFCRTVSETPAANSAIENRFGNAQDRFRKQSRIMLLLLCSCCCCCCCCCYVFRWCGCSSRRAVQWYFGVPTNIYFYILLGFQAWQPMCSCRIFRGLPTFFPSRMQGYG